MYYYCKTKKELSTANLCRNTIKSQPSKLTTHMGSSSFYHNSGTKKYCDVWTVDKSTFSNELLLFFQDSASTFKQNGLLVLSRSIEIGLSCTQHCASKALKQISFRHQYPKVLWSGQLRSLVHLSQQSRPFRVITRVGREQGDTPNDSETHVQVTC